MPSVLKNVLRFTGLAIGTPSIQAHGLHLNGIPAIPKNVWLSGGGYTTVADAINVTVTREMSGAEQVDVAVGLWHSMGNAQPLPGGIGLSLLPFIMQGHSSANPALISAPNGDVVPLIVGTPIIFSATQFVRGAANALATSNVVGLVSTAGVVGAIVVVQVIGALTLTTAQWDLVSGQVGGLTPDVCYFLSVSSGLISTTAPVNPTETVVEVGHALSPTIMLVRATSPILL